MSGNFFDSYPYTDFHELNLDWVLKKIKKVDKKVDDFTALNNITWAGVWSADKSYLKWSIVQDASGNGFLAIKAVPPNVSINNNEYWSQIAKYESLYAAFDQRISNNSNDISNLKDNVLSLKNDSYHKYIFLGDSYNEGYQANNYGWGQRIIDLLKLKGSYSFYQAGTGFATSVTFLTVLQNNISNIKDKNSITDLIVCGGFNDYNHTKQSIMTNITSFCNYVKSNLPNAKIHIGMIGHTTGRADVTNGLISNVIPAYMEGAQENGACYIPNSEIILHNVNLFNSDMTHPNNDGQNKLRNQLINYIIGKGIDIIPSFASSDVVATITPVSGYTETLSLYTVQHNDITYLYFTVGNINLGSDKEIVGNQDFKIATITGSNIMSVMGSYPKINTEIYVRNSENQYNKYDAQFTIQNNNGVNELWLKIFIINNGDTQWGTETVSFITGFNKNVVISIPTLMLG